MGEYAFLAVYRNSFGMSIQSLKDPGNGMTTVWVILAAEWAVFMAAAWYAEKVLATGTGGNKRRICFCFEGLWSCIWRQKRTRTESAVQEDGRIRLPVAVPMAVPKMAKQPQPPPQQQQQQQQLHTQQEQPDSICIPIAAAAAAGPHAAASKPDAVAAAAAAAVEEPSDVAAERSKVQQLQQYSSHPIVVRDLQKTYPGQDGQPDKVL
jgi:hypothetical protein